MPYTTEASTPLVLSLLMHLLFLFHNFFSFSFFFLALLSVPIMCLFYLGPLLLIAFELNPLNSKFDQCVKSRLQPIRLFYDAYTVDNIISFFLLPKEIQMNKMSSIAANTLEELKTQSRAGLQHVISERRLLDLDVELSSPVVVIPEGGVRTESGRGKLLVLNCGSLFVTSCIQDHVPDVQVCVVMMNLNFY